MTVVKHQIMSASLCTGRWEARIGIPGSKHIYLGLHDDEDSAAKAYDSALVSLVLNLPDAINISTYFCYLKIARRNSNSNVFVLLYKHPCISLPCILSSRSYW